MSARSTAELYEDDFYAWTQLQVKELRRFARSRPNLPLDLAPIAEEVADLGIEHRHRIRSWTRRILEHLLLLEHLRLKRSDAAGSSRSSISGARSAITSLRPCAAT